MSATISLFEQAQLTEAAYANFNLFLNNPKGALEDQGFSSTQASEFVTHWQVVSHTSNLDSGFSATVFESLDHPGEFSLAIRGSIPDQLDIDFKADAQLIISDGIAVTQLVDSRPCQTLTVRFADFAVMCQLSDAGSVSNLTR